MYRLITFDDFLEIYIKARQRGLSFILSKFSISKNKRTISAFNESAALGSNWWTIPYVIERWNKLISGNPSVNDKVFLINEVLADIKEPQLLSLGAGSCNNEMELAGYHHFKEITCVDLSPYRLSEAEKKIREKGYHNFKFICSDIKNYHFPENHFDIVYFNSSLHHFSNVKSLIEDKVFKCLKNNGLLVINEYVGPSRMQFPPKQIQAINRAIRLIPRYYRKRYKTNLTKNFFSGPGLIRMVMADPSECIDSGNIIPSIHKYFTPVVEKPYGGNILMHVLKDIAYNFIELNSEKQKVLDELFHFEDQYLRENPSNFVFGIYKKILTKDD